MKSLRDFTAARVALGRTGHSLPTAELLDFQLAHARARDAVHSSLDVASLTLEVRQRGRDCIAAKSAAPDRQIYLRRPDLGRRLNADSAQVMRDSKGEFDVVFVIADGLSALAVHRYALAVLDSGMARLPGWSIAPIVLLEQGRVAAGDEIANLLGASMAAILLGERPGLSAPDSLGIYMTWKPASGVTTEAERNCISNVRTGGLSPDAAAERLVFLLTEARRRKISGVRLKGPDRKQSLLEPTALDPTARDTPRASRRSAEQDR
jgi:ethanolamine ammonia-lyase small subunit